jgi:hypothetical protein
MLNGRVPTSIQERKLHAGTLLLESLKLVDVCVTSLRWFFLDNYLVVSLLLVLLFLLIKISFHFMQFLDTVEHHLKF